MTSEVNKIEHLSALVYSFFKNTQILNGFSTAKDTLILVSGNQHLKIEFFEGQSYFFFLNHNPKSNLSNKQSQFKELHSEEIESYLYHPHDRIFALKTKNQWKLVFKLFGKQSNLILFNPDGNVVESFIKSYENDKQKPFDEYFLPSKMWKTDSRYVEIDFIGWNKQEGRLLNDLKQTKIYQEKNAALQDKIKRAQKKIDGLQRQFLQFKEAVPPIQIADTLMAHIHKEIKGHKSINLNNVHTSTPISIKLNADLSLQENAEKYYRKHKKQEEIESNIQNQIRGTEKELKDLILESTELNDKYQHGTLISKKKDKKFKNENVLPYKVFNLENFEVRIGKNASANDDLLRITHKEDLWFHAKDYSGSHVVILDSRNGVAPYIIEKVASLAAFYSKAKHQSLAPVIYTQRKYVRKFKGSLAGQVKVERENIVLVEPLDTSQI